MFLPYRAKNPPECFPYATVSLIAVNVLVFLATIDSTGGIRESVLQAAGVSHNTLSLGRLFTAMFLHENLLHIAGNMLFLWIFGASLEARIGWWRFLPLYFFAGLTGGLLHDLLLGVSNPDLMSLGASGAIMGLAGAYLYTFPYSTICVFRAWYFRFGVMEWQARWVVLYYVGLDVLEAWLFRSMDGVGHFAHIGGFAMGLLGAWLMGAPRDNEEYSNAQASRAETGGDPTLLNFYELETLMQRPNPTPDIVTAYAEKALVSPGQGESKCLAALQQHARLLIERGDGVRLTEVVLRLTPETARALPTVFFLRLGSKLEQAGANEQAIRVYYRLGELSPQSPDFEVALFRLGRMAEQVYQDNDQARYFYGEMQRLFPAGPMLLEAQRALAHLPQAPAAART